MECKFYLHGISCLSNLIDIFNGPACMKPRDIWCKALNMVTKGLSSIFWKCLSFLADHLWVTSSVIQCDRPLIAYHFRSTLLNNLNKNLKVASVELNKYLKFCLQIFIILEHSNDTWLTNSSIFIHSYHKREKCKSQRSRILLHNNQF